jgi:transcriptional regulator with XRE-family HTH domain
MGTRERRIDRANAITTKTRTTVGRELREARVAAGLSQREVGTAVGMSHSQVSRIELGGLANVTVEQLSRLAISVGLEVSVRLYPAADPVRDVAHIRLLERLRSKLHPSLTWRTEVPLPIPGDLRAWDAVVAGAAWKVAIEAETRVADAQALQRRLSRKLRDGQMPHVLLLVADTVRNREAVAQWGSGLGAMFPASARVTLDALRQGTDPGGSGIVIL